MLSSVTSGQKEEPRLPGGGAGEGLAKALGESAGGRGAPPGWAGLALCCPAPSLFSGATSTGGSRDHRVLERSEGAGT